jgi:hypothetical protein
MTHVRDSVPITGLEGKVPGRFGLIITKRMVDNEGMHLRQTSIQPDLA